MVVGLARTSLHLSVRRFIERHHVRVDVFKFGGRQLVREELLADAQVQQAILEAVRAGESPASARARVEQYVEEIAPRFSLIAYFQFGYAVANTCMRLLYRVQPDLSSQRRLQQVPGNASVMYIANHRSNADYVLLALVLARRVAVSFAVGEWARVFPLDHLFKLFGGYFLRRNFRDRLYHTVLRRYMQLIVRRGVTQGLFPEGRLSRDGRLGDPKIGLLDAMVSMAAEPGFDRPIVFVPVGLNFDRVLEDGTLVRETVRTRPPTALEKAVSLLRIAWWLPMLLLRGAKRVSTGSLNRFGLATAGFGEPLSLAAFAERHGMTAAQLAALPPDRRRPLVKELADELMQRIGSVIPGTPVTVTCRALMELDGSASKSALVARVHEVAQRLREQHTPVILGRDAEPDAELSPREPSAQEELGARERAEECTRIAIERLLRRRLIVVRDRQISIRPGAERIVAYYAHSLAALDTEGAALRQTG